MKAKTVTFIIASVLLVGCASLNTVSSFDPVYNDTTVFTYNDELQNTFFRKGPNGTKICLAPTPDAAQTMSEGVGFGGSGSGEGGEVEDATGAIGLGGRNPEVLVTRELMYRACELSMNMNTNYKETRSIYTEFLAAVKAIAKSQTGEGSASVSAAAVLPQSMIPSKDSDDSSSSDDYYSGDSYYDSSSDTSSDSSDYTSGGSSS